MKVNGLEEFLEKIRANKMPLGAAITFTDPAVTAVLDECCRKVREKGILLGCYTERDFDLWRKRGVQFMAIKNDTNAMMLGFQTMVERVEKS